MKISTIQNKLCCPFDKSDLKLEIIEQTVDQDIRIGSLTCTTCKRFYPIISGIPIMNPDEFRDSEIEKIYYESLSRLGHPKQIENFRLIE